MTWLGGHRADSPLAIGITILENLYSIDGSIAQWRGILIMFASKILYRLLGSRSTWCQANKSGGDCKMLTLIQMAGVPWCESMLRNTWLFQGKNVRHLHVVFLCAFFFFSLMPFYGFFPYLHIKNWNWFIFLHSHCKIHVYTPRIDAH